jgi:hypothetical protein
LFLISLVSHLFSSQAAVERLERDGHDIFANPRPALQLSSQNYKVVEHNVAESGGLHPILNLSDARAAIHTIVTQVACLLASLFDDLLFLCICVLHVFDIRCLFVCISVDVSFACFV